MKAIMPSPAAFLLAAACVIASAPSAWAQAPDGGPWAPALIELDSLEVTPRNVAPGDPIHVQLRCRPGQAQKITTLSFETNPRLLELKATRFLDVESGLIDATIPGDRLPMEGEFELRMPMDFR